MLSPALMDNYNPDWVWYACGIMSIVAIARYLFLHFNVRERSGNVAEKTIENEEIIPSSFWCSLLTVNRAFPFCLRGPCIDHKAFTSDLEFYSRPIDAVHNLSCQTFAFFYGFFVLENFPSIVACLHIHCDKRRFVMMN